MSHYGNLALVAAGTTVTLVLGVTTIAGAIDTTASCMPGPSAGSEIAVSCSGPDPAVETVTATATATATVTVTPRSALTPDEAATRNPTRSSAGRAQTTAP